MAAAESLAIDTTQVQDNGNYAWYINGVKRTVHVLVFMGTGPEFYDGCANYNTYSIACGLDPATNSALKVSASRTSPGPAACGGPN